MRKKSVKTIKVYKFNELNEISKQKAIEQRQELALEIFYDGEINDYLDEIAQSISEKGFKISSKDLHYDISGCQGSGLCFDNASLDLEKLAKKLNHNITTNDIYDWEIESYIFTSSHNYCHPRTRSVVLTYAKSHNISQKAIERIEAFEKVLNQYYIDICNDAYKFLSNTIDWYYRDENIIDIIKCEDDEFLEDGTRFYD